MKRMQEPFQLSRSARVANVAFTSCDGGDWLATWEEQVERYLPHLYEYWLENGQLCQLEDCQRDAKVGGHMYVMGMPEQMNYILPLCSKCNGQRSLDCGNGQCRRSMGVKSGAVVLPMVQNACVRQAQERNWPERQHRTELANARQVSGQNIGYLNDIGSVMRKLTNGGEAYVFFTMKGCPHCDDIKEAWGMFAKRKPQGTCFFVRIDMLKEDEVDEIENIFNFDSYPTIIKYDGRRHSDITEQFQGR